MGCDQEAHPRGVQGEVVKIELMFVNGSEPLVDWMIRAPLTGESWRTNPEGRIATQLAAGRHIFEVSSDGESWREHLVNVRDSSPGLLVVNLEARRSTGSWAGATSEVNFLSSQLDQLGGRYQFERLLGRGGMGVVFKAEDTLLSRPVAIKVLNEELRYNPEAQKIFLAEARSLATLKHPNLVSVHDVTTQSDFVFMVTEYVEGRNLDRWLRKNGRLEQDVIISIGAQLAAGLDYLHNKGMIHRDLKPGNVILKDDGAIKVIDFGLARSLDEISIRGTQVRGTPAYMAPEQIRGDALTPQTDLYQFGITLYELLSGQLPFPSGDMAYAHVHKTPPAIDELVPGIVPELALLIHRCLKKEPSERPSSAAELLRSFRELQAAGVGASTTEMRALGNVTSPDFAVPITYSAIADTAPDPAPVLLDMPTIEPASPRLSNSMLWLIAGGLFALIAGISVGVFMAIGMDDPVEPGPSDVVASAASSAAPLDAPVVDDTEEAPAAEDAPAVEEAPPVGDVEPATSEGEPEPAAPASDPERVLADPEPDDELQPASKAAPTRVAPARVKRIKKPSPPTSDEPPADAPSINAPQKIEPAQGLAADGEVATKPTPDEVAPLAPPDPAPAPEPQPGVVDPPKPQAKPAAEPDKATPKTKKKRVIRKVKKSPKKSKAKEVVPRSF